MRCIHVLACISFTLVCGSSAHAATTSVPPGLNTLRDAINAANPGDTLLLQANAVYGGYGCSTISLPVKTGTGWITIQSDALASLPAGQRVKPNHAAFMPKIVSGGRNATAIKAAPGAHHYKFVGCEFYTGDSINTTALVELGTSNSTQDTVAEIPYAFILDRCYLHAISDTQWLTRAIAMNCGRGIANGDTTYSEVTNCHISGCKTNSNNDSQAVGGSNGGGPYRILNNYLESVGENIIFGGSKPFTRDVLPSDIEVRGNHFYKPLSWRGVWPVKNLFELKFARRITIEGNVFENCWTAGQTGVAIVLKLANYDGDGDGNPLDNSDWVVTEDVTFRNNIVRHAAGACSIQGRDYDNNSPQGLVRRLNIVNNLWEDINGPAYNGSGHFLYLSHGPINVTYDHNTAFHTGQVLEVDTVQYPATGFVFKNNINPHNTYGVRSTSGTGNPTFNTYFTDPGHLFVKNILMGGNPALYTSRPDNFFPPTWNDVFVNHAAGDYHVRAGTGFKAGEVNDATDGKDLGADLGAIATATAGVIQNSPNILPTVAIAYPLNNQTICVVNANVTIKAYATDSAGTVTRVEFFIDGVKQGEDLASPYTWTWVPTVLRSYTLTAKVTDNNGAVVTSAPVNVTVTSTNMLPTISVSATAQNNSFVAPANITLDVNTNDPDGIVSKVDFYRNGVLLGTDTTSGFSYAWNSVPAGTYSVTARATDNSGGVTTSSAITVTVTGPNAAPSITSAATATPNPAQTGQSIAFSAAATDVDGDTLSYSWNFADGTPAGSGASVSHSYTAAGTYNVVVTVTDGRGGSVTSSVSVTVTAGAAPLPAPWLQADVGACNYAGSASYSGGTFTVQASGKDIWDAADAFHYVYQSVTGDAEISMRVASFTNVGSTWALACVMFRESLAANSRHASMMIQDAAHPKTKFRCRLSTGGITDYSSGTALSIPRYIKIKRVGNVFTCHSSTDGTTWTLYDSAVTVNLPSTVLVGFMVARNDNAGLVTASITNVNVTRAWRSADVGACNYAGSFSENAGTFTVNASGTDIWDVADAFHYVYQPMTGDGEIEARVSSFANVGSTWALACVMFRESLAANSRHASMMIQDAAHPKTKFRCRLATGGITGYSNGTPLAIPRHIKIKRVGNVFTCYSSTDGTNWTPYDSAVTVNMTGTVLVGFMAARNDNAGLTNATFTNVKLTRSNPW